MADIINEEIHFSDGISNVSVGASKSSKMTVCSAWSEYCGEYCSDSSRSIPIQDLFKFLRKKDKYIRDEAYILCGKQVEELDARLNAVEKNVREKDGMIYKLEEKIKAYKSIIKDLKEDRGT